MISWMRNGLMIEAIEEAPTKTATNARLHR